MTAGHGARERVPLVGLTGGIGAGKSEALAALGRLGAATLSSDAVVHDLLASEEVRDLVVERLGPQVAPGGALDRAAMASAVFERPSEREWLEQLLWPRVGARVADWYQRLSGLEPRPSVAVVEVPLLFESGMEKLFDSTIAVVADEAARAERAGARGHEALESRTERQLGQEEKAQRADFAIRNDGTLGELEENLSKLLETMVT